MQVQQQLSQPVPQQQPVQQQLPQPQLPAPWQGAVLVPINAAIQNIEEPLGSGKRGTILKRDFMNALQISETVYSAMKVIITVYFSSRAPLTR